MVNYDLVFPMEPQAPEIESDGPGHYDPTFLQPAKASVDG